MKRTWIILLIIIGVASTGVAESATYYVGKSGSNANLCGAAQSNAVTSRKLTIASGLTCLSPGDTLVIGNGTYAESLASVPNGSAGSGYITIQAETDDGVILTGGLSLVHTNQYIVVTGLRFQDVGGTKVVLGNHLKFFRNEFKYGCPSDNCVNTQIGTNDFNDTADILFEENWWHGSGGRYTILLYNANRVILRRAVVRHDGGWTDSKGDPEAGITFYNTANSACLNCIILDSTLTYHAWQSAFYNVYNSASPNSNANNSYLGSISLNNREPGNADGASMRFDGDVAQTGHLITDFVGWDTNWCINISFASAISVAINRATCGNNTRTGTGYGFGSGSSGSKTLTNLIIANENTADLSGPSATFFDTYNNGTTSSGTGQVTYSPFTNGLLYLPRIEASTPLKTAGSGGGQMGAQIVNKIGTSGSLYGETNWNTDTGTVLWPWPNEARIKKDLCTDAGVTRGFCASTSLTDYIWQYLGNKSPINGSSDVTPPAAPTNLRLS